MSSRRIDATFEDGCFGRLVNDDHRTPNQKPKVKNCNRKPRIVFHALRDIKPLEELVYCYGGGTYSWRKKTKNQDVTVSSPLATSTNEHQQAESLVDLRENLKVWSMSAMDQTRPTTNLFGGALSAVFPPDAQDMSNFREIPDHQEVFTHSVTDQSIIIEILEYVQEPDDVALKTHYEDLVRDNDVGEGDHVILEAAEIPAHKLAMSQCESARYVLGQQKVSKFKEVSKNTINIHMGLFRIPEFTTDILVTFNDPVMINLSSSSNQAVPTNADRWMVDEFQQLLATLTINDTGLFGAE